MIDPPPESGEIWMHHEGKAYCILSQDIHLFRQVDALNCLVNVANETAKMIEFESALIIRTVPDLLPLST